MTTRSELSISAVGTGWKAADAEFSWPLISAIIRKPDVLLLLGFGVIGLVLAALLALFVPLPDDIATALAQFS